MADNEVIARSPCLGDCNLCDDGVCHSCFLSAAENDRWNQASNEERLAMLENTKLRQQANSEGKPISDIGT